MPGSRFVVRTLSGVGLVASLRLAVLAAEPPPQGAATSFSGTTYSGTAAGEIRDDNGLRTKLVWIPPGSFVMGSPAGEKDRREDEKQVQVTFSRGFWLGQHEVTQSEWRRVMRTTPWSGELSVKEGNDFPATFVNWDDAMKFCARLTAIEQAAGRLPKNWKYTLPTEAQWEYACRAGTTTRYSFGPGDSALPDYGWFDKNTTSPVESNPRKAGRRRVVALGERYAHEVATKKANSWGLYDMHGNAFEWCRDGYAKDLPGGRDPEVPAAGELRMVRGGSWVITSAFCRSAHRDWDTPDTRTNSLGFRLAVVPIARK